ncbi:MAG: hydroxysqualene dehydroxylase HpnE [Planctomycetales bacterium]|nr:hydroxysqualene dehydroxylase HpnE [Planctomycetales bacterium]
MGPVVAGGDGRPRVVVVGGGLAGISAAVHLAEGGAAVTLCERRPFLGGRTWSVPLRPGGPEVDNGQHVILRCCTAFLDLVRRIGAERDVTVQDRLDIPFLDGRGGVARLRALPLPSPLHLLPSLLRFHPLSIGERLGVLRAGARIRAMAPAERDRLDDRTFEDWLRQNGQSPRAIRRFWDVFILAAVNLPSREASAGLCLTVFAESLLAGPRAADVGLPRVGLSRLVHDRSAAWLAARPGTELRLDRRVDGVLVEGDRALGVRLGSGETLPADAVVLAVPAEDLADLLPAPWREDPFFAGPATLGTSPILGVHLGYDRPVIPEGPRGIGEFAAVLDSPIQWVFDRGRVLGRPAEAGRSLSCVVSAPRAPWLSGKGPAGKEATVRVATEALARILPLTRGARLLWSRVVLEKRATFSARPGTAAARRPAETPIAGLVLAGAWTRTGWPATMEGAVRSGAEAARRVAAVAAFRAVVETRA